MNPTPNPTRPCPVCASFGDRQILHRQHFQEGVLGDGYDVAVCAECGAGFADGIPQQAELDRYYLEHSKYSYDASGGAESPYDLQRFQMIAEQLTPYISSRSCRILDVGCATGGLLSVFKQRGFANIVGADPSPACADAARKLYGIEVRTAPLSQLSEWRDRFDLILMVGVLEHVREVRHAVETIADCLNTDGNIFVAVPDVEVLASCHDAPYQQFSMEHVNFFSSASLCRLMAGCGFAMQRTWQTVVEWREGITEPVLGGLYASAIRGEKAAALRHDNVTEPALKRYLARSQKEDESIASTIGAIVRSGRAVLIWGAGALTRRLLVTTPLGEANIAGFVDSNPHLQGGQLVGRRILSPEQVVGRSENILICSVTFEREITRTIRERLKLTNDLIMLGPASR